MAIDLFDRAAKVATLARKGGLKGSQVERLIEVYEGVSDPEEAYKTLIVFIYRQASRKERGKEIIDRTTANVLAETIEQIHKEMGREGIRKFLGLFKWMFESLELVRGRVNPVDKFEDYVNTLRSALPRR
ncbi:MAG: hypothetical protein ACTSXX_14255 [Candidatus Baldrarchaeia archaeon]